MSKGLAIAIVLVAATAVIEALNLHAIVNHQASGGDPNGNAFFMLSAWASIPLLGSVVLAFVSHRRSRGLPLVAIASALAIGAILSTVALAQYSHATPGFLMLGFAAQCVILLVAAFRRPRNAI